MQQNNKKLLKASEILKGANNDLLNDGRRK